jgi:hypothetical protein
VINCGPCIPAYSARHNDIMHFKICIQKFANTKEEFYFLQRGIHCST